MFGKALFLLAIAFAPLRAQTAERNLPNGKELVAVYVGASTCEPCLQPAIKSAVPRMKTLLSDFAKKNGYAFSAVGVAIDWSTDRGAAFLSGNGPFDQLVIGGNWTNLAAEHYIWSDRAAVPAMPQIVLLERSVIHGERLAFTPTRVISRIIGLEEIPKWVAAGAPVALPSQTPTSK
jgi:hypothetical protein